MTEYTFGQTRAALELLKQNVELLQEKIKAYQDAATQQNTNIEALENVRLDEVKQTALQALQKIDETTALIDEVLK